MILRRSVEGSLFALLILSLEVSNAFICHPRPKGHHHHTSPQEGVGRGRIMMVTPSMFTTPPPPSSPPAIEQSAIKPVSSKPTTGLSNLLEGDQVPTYAPTEEEKDPFSALIAASSLDMDIPVWRPTLIQSVLVFLGVPALFFAGLKVFGNKGKPQGSLAHQEAIDKMSTSEILVKLYKDIEDEFQTLQSLERTTPDSFSGTKDSEAQKSFLKPKREIEEDDAVLVDYPPAVTVDEEHKEHKEKELNAAKEASTTAAAAAAEKRGEDEEEEKEAAAVAAKKLKVEQEAKALEAKRIADEEARAKLGKQKKEKEAAAEKEAAKAAAAAAAAKAKKEEEQRAKQQKAEAEVKRKEVEAKQKLEAAASAKKRKDEAAERARIEEAKKAIKAEIDARAKAAAAAKEKPDAEAAAAAEKKSSTKAARSQTGKTAGGVNPPAAAVGDSDTKPKQQAAPAATPSEDKAPPKKKSSSKAGDDDEWAEMRRLQKESDELLGMSAMLGSPGKPPKDRMPPAPEAEFVKRGRGTTESAFPSPTVVTQLSTGGKKMSKAASKAAAEAERKELLQGLDAVMVDLQQRSDEKRVIATAEEKEKKDKKTAAAAVKESPAPAATASESHVVVAKTKAKAPATQVDLSKSVASLTIPKLKQFLEENKGEMPGSKAKKVEYVAAAMAVLQSKAKESSIDEALKLLKEK